MEKLIVKFDDGIWQYTINFTCDSPTEQEETTAQVIADIAQHPYNPVSFTYHDDGICGEKDTDNSDTLSGRDAIGYIISFFNDDLKPEIMRLAAEETATYDAENWLKGTMYYPAEEETEEE